MKKINSIGEKRNNPEYNRPTIVIPVLLIVIGILMLIYAYSNNESNSLVVEILKVVGIELIVGSAVVLFNYLIYGREIKNQDLSGETYEKLEKIVESHNKSLLSNIATNKELAPLYTYKACDEPNVEFNRFVNAALKESLEYTYFGDSSTYFVSRLKSMGSHTHKIINVYIPDFHIEKLFTSHKSEIRKRYGAKDVTPEQTIITARMRILQNMYVLKKLTNNYTISLYLHKEIPFLRFEIARFDNTCGENRNFFVLSFLPIDVNQKRFPPSFIYNNSTFYATFNGYLQELKERAELICLDTYNFVEEAKKIDPSLNGQSDEFIISQYFESHFDHLTEVDMS